MSASRMDRLIAELRKAAVEADERGHLLREQALDMWLAWPPHREAVSLMYRKAVAEFGR